MVGFCGHNEGRTALSWNGKFTTWLANQAKWNKQRGGHRVPAPQVGVADEAEANAWGRAQGEALIGGAE
ncbi:MAG TPA: hypothetical protein VJN18_14850 [Polyangiaceae bacterium]|nr:hypothetical protein [Polyangiaceae bacterium]